MLLCHFFLLLAGCHPCVCVCVLSLFACLFLGLVKQGEREREREREREAMLILIFFHHTYMVWRSSSPSSSSSSPSLFVGFLSLAWGEDFDFKAKGEPDIPPSSANAHCHFFFSFSLLSALFPCSISRCTPTQAASTSAHTHINQWRGRMGRLWWLFQWRRAGFLFCFLDCNRRSLSMSSTIPRRELGRGQAAGAPLERWRIRTRATCIARPKREDTQVLSECQATVTIVIVVIAVGLPSR